MTILELKSQSLGVPCNPLVFFLRRMLFKLLWPFFEKLLGVMNETNTKQNATASEIAALKQEVRDLRVKIESLNLQERESMDLMAIANRLLTIENRLDV